jgi:hypothetical protein
MTTNAEYHASSRLSKSKLDLINKAPALYKYRIIDGNRRKETPALAFGTAAHMFCFEPHLLQSTYWVFDDAAKVAEIGGAKPRNTSAYQLWKAEQFQNNAGKTMLDPDDLPDLQGIQGRFQSHPIIAEYLAQPHTTETVLYGTILGVEVQCKCDYVTDGAIIDLKTTEDATEYGVVRSVRKYRYDVQDALYAEIYRQNFGTWPRFIFAFVEKTAPYLCELYELSEFDREQAHEKYRDDIQTFIDCTASGNWHGISKTPQINEICL